MTQIIRTWNQTTIRQREDGYVCLTDMAKSTGKKFSHWNQLDSSKNYLNVLSSVTGIPATGLVQVFQGGLPESQGTWGHPKVSLRFAQWCSDEFAVQVDFWIDELLTKGSVSLQPAQPALPQDYLSALKALVESEEQKQLLAAENKEQKKALKEAAPKLEEHESILSKSNLFLIRDAAKIIAAKDTYNKPVGEKVLRAFLRNLGVFAQNGAVYQKYITAEYFEMVPGGYTGYSGYRETETAKITGKGLIWLRKQLRDAGYNIP